MRIHLQHILPDDFDRGRLIEALADDYTIKEERSASNWVAIYDTFDWRLYDKSYALYGTENRLFLRKLYANRSICSFAFASPPVFVWDFSESELRRRLEPILKKRALLKLAKVHCRSVVYRILNPNEKTVSRLHFEEFRLSSKRGDPIMTNYLRIQPVKGYRNFSQKLVGSLGRAGCRPYQKEDVYFRVLEAAGEKPGSYSSKLNIELDPNMRSDEATKVLLRYLLQIVKINGDYIKKDLDTEFLHDYRVAVRRIRSALGQIKSVFPPKTVGGFKRDFAFVGKSSNSLRDLDVYLLKETAFKAMLPAVLKEDIDPLFDYLRKKRSRAFRQVVKNLESIKYQQIIKRWEEFLTESQEDAAEEANARFPVIDLARKSIFKQYRRVIRTSVPISEAVEDQELHDLRLECKKLRYLMDFFSGLFSAKKIDAFIEQLKTLQDCLGDFNDSCVQEEYLAAIAEELPATDQKTQRALLAIGSLIGSLDRKKRSVKKAFLQIFAEFASSENKREFHKLFAS